MLKEQVIGVSIIVAIVLVVIIAMTSANADCARKVCPSGGRPVFNPEMSPACACIITPVDP